MKRRNIVYAFNCEEGREWEAANSLSRWHSFEHGCSDPVEEGELIEQIRQDLVLFVVNPEGTCFSTKNIRRNSTWIEGEYYETVYVRVALGEKSKVVLTYVPTGVYTDVSEMEHTLIDNYGSLATAKGDD